MNLLGVIHIGIATFSVVLGIIVYKRDMRNEVNQFFGVFCGLAAFCAFVDFLIAGASSEAEVYIFLHLVSIRLLLFTVLLHFFIIYSGYASLRRWSLLVPSYLITVALIIIGKPEEIFIVKKIPGIETWGFWADKATAFNAMMFAWIAAQIFFVNIIGISMAVKARRTKKQLPAMFVIYGIMISLLLPVVTDILVPMAGFNLPQLSSLAFMLGNVVIGYGVLKHGLFLFKPEDISQQILNNISDSVIITDTRGEILFMNGAFRRLTGLGEQEGSDKNISDFFETPVNDETFGTSAFPAANTLKTKESERQVIISFSLSTGLLPGIKERLFIIHDVSELHNSINNLRISQEKYKNIFENILDIYVEFTPDGTLTEVSPSCEVFTGYNREELLGEKVSQPFINKADYEKLMESLMMNGSVKDYELVLRHKNGTQLYFLGNMKTLYDDSGNPSKIVGTMSEITSLKNSEMLLRESENKYRFFLINFPGIVYRADVLNNLEFIFGDLDNLLGYSQEQLMVPGFDFQKVIHPADLTRMVTSYRDLINEKCDEVTLRFRVIRPDGNISKLRAWFQLTKENAGQSRYIQGVLYDDTTESETNERIMDAVIETEERERLRFSEDLHDELGPMLSSIRMYVNTIQSKNKPEQERERMLLLEQSIGLIDDAIEQARNISRNMVPELLTDYGLVPSIKSFCNQINSGRIISIDLQLRDIDEDFRFNSIAELALFRVLKELISNTIKHARANNIIISFTRRNNMVIIEYYDDGIGFDFSENLKKKGSLGLKNIVNRVGNIGGSLRFTNIAGGGVLTVIEVVASE